MEYKLGDGKVLYEVFREMDHSITKYLVYIPYDEMSDSMKQNWESIAKEFLDRIDLYED